jgi:N-acetylglucosamine kinase-like BadF-type ATPase
MPQTVANNPDLILGVDGGGTKTVAWLAAKDSAYGVLGRGASGPSNPRAMGFAQAQANINQAIDFAFGAAGLSRSTAVAACLALSGVGRSADREQMEEWAKEKRLAETIQVTTDAEPILAAASPQNCGVALICGTGSLTWGRNGSGSVARAGGWGYLLGDEGSAYWLSVSGLRAAVCAFDGSSPETALLPTFLDRLQLAEPRDLVDWVYDPANTPSRIASLAPVVFGLAANDRVAAKIVDAGAQTLAATIETVGRRLGFSQSGYLLALSGSVITKQSTYRERMLSYLAKRNFAPLAVTCVDEPVQGAIHIARTLCPA